MCARACMCACASRAGLNSPSLPFVRGSRSRDPHLLFVLHSTRPSYHTQASWDGGTPSVLSPAPAKCRPPLFPPKHETGGEWLIVSNVGSVGAFITAIKVGSWKLSVMADLLIQLSLSHANHLQQQPEQGTGLY